MKLTFDKTTPKGIYEELFKQKIGYVFKVEDADYETVMERMTEYLPNPDDFEVFPITPGTDLYSMYGASHCVIIHNGLI